ncbi:MAG: biotin--[acetyl-CoA-carboxylase] ligase [Propionicimonas sp.]
MSSGEGVDGNPRVDADWLAHRLVRTDGLWTKVTTLAATGSTNADLAGAAAGPDASGRILIADYQRAGRGRFTRVWEAPPGTSLAISVLLRPPATLPLRRWLWLPLLTGLAVADGLRGAGGVLAELKWPNDVLIDDRKVAGILAERVGDAVVLGMGINTTLRADQLPVPTATSLALAGAAVEPGEVAACVLEALEGWYRRWVDGEDLRPAYVGRCTSVGRDVRVQLSATEAAVGRASGIDPDGCLVVEVGGRERVFAAGDVVHLR